MWYLYVDESGDLGFDFFSKKPSKFFTVCFLLVRGAEHNRALISAVNKTIRRKIRKSDGAELKGAKTSIEVKRYFYRSAQEIPFQVFAVTLNKRRVYDYLQAKKDRLYNFIARQALDHIPLGDATTRIELIMDRCKTSAEVADFNCYVAKEVEGRVDPRIPLTISQQQSHENRGLQAVDLFSWGVFRSYERGDREWKQVFEKNIKPDMLYLK